MEENKVKLECDYCGVPIGENDHKCPNCGANCTEKIKKYKAQKAKEDEEEKQRRIEQSKNLQKQLDKPVKFAIILFIVVFLFIVGVMIVLAIVGIHDTFDIEKGIECKQDSYELYNYVSDDFPEHYNTPEGYQKIAFHIVCENNGEGAESLTAFDVKLTADDYAVKVASLKVGTFERVVEGKSEYPSILNNDIEVGEKLQGYLGYVVPKDKKVLKLTIKGKTTTLDNPVYVEG